MILRVRICIPTYNNPLTIASVIDDALIKTAFPVLVVDDGSETPVERLLSLSARNELAHGRLVILRHEKNQGKGLALQRAIHDSVAHGHTHLMAVDGDGQHHLSEVQQMVELAKENPWALVIGNRKFKTATVPGISKFGRKFSNFWVQFQTGTTVADSQSGFRLYPLFFCQNMRFWTKRYDFEIEILIRLMWQGVQVRETEIEVFYPEKNQRVSHFNKFWDNIRISCLNMLFVVVSLLKTHRSPREVAAATGAGVFIGCTPFFGLHTAIVALVSFLFRLNAGFLWMGSQVSIPPLAPFLVIGSIGIGRKITSLWKATSSALTIDANHHSIRDLIQFGSRQLLEWFVGSIILGAVLGLISALFTYILARRLSRRKTGKSNWSGRTRGGKIGNGFLKLVLKHLSFRAGYICLYFIIPYFYLFAPRARRSLNEYWRNVAPEMRTIKRQLVIVRHLYRFGQILMDRLAQSFSAQPLFTTTSLGYENIRKFYTEKKAVILLGAHVGGWDLAAFLMKKSGPDTKLHIVEYRAPELSFNHVKEKKNSEHIKSVDSNSGAQPIFDIHQVLNEGLPMGLMGDRPLANRFELVSFFGKLAPFDTTPFRMAAASRVPIIKTFGFKAKGSNYDFFADSPQLLQYSPEADRQIQCLVWTQNFATRLSEMLKLYPEQWFNFFEFWSSLPTSPVPLADGEPACETKPALRAAAPNRLLEELRKPQPQKSASAPVP